MRTLKEILADDTLADDDHLDRPDITGEEFDAALDELVKIKPEGKPEKKIGKMVLESLRAADLA